MEIRWSQLCQRLDQLEPGSAIRTPVSDRLFEIVATVGDRIDIQFQDSGRTRSLHREQFAVLADRVDTDSLALDSLPSGVEPYAAVLSFAPGYISADGALSRASETSDETRSPHYVSPEAARTPPERVHDDALLLSDLLEQVDTETLSTLDTERLTDLYVLLSDVQRGSDRYRRSVSSILLERLGPDQQRHGRFGTIRHTTRERRHVKDDETVLDALDEHGIPHEWVLGVDPDKLDVVLAVTELDESAVYDTEQQAYVQKTGTDEETKFSRLQGLSDRLEEVEGGEQLQADIADLERRIEEALSA